MFTKLPTRFRFTSTKNTVGIWLLVCFFLFCSLCVSISVKVHCQLLYFLLSFTLFCQYHLSRFFLPLSSSLFCPNSVFLPCVPSAEPIQIRFIAPFLKKIREKRVSVPDLIACRARLIHNTALSLTPKDGCIPAVVMCSHGGCLPLLLKESTQMEKWQALRRHQPCRSPLPSLCFSSPCDHICICLRAETIEI